MRVKLPSLTLDPEGAQRTEGVDKTLTLYPLPFYPSPLTSHLSSSPLHMQQQQIKSELLTKLKQEHCFWSFREDTITDISDDILIEKTLLHLDLEEINKLFKIFPFKRIKRVWLECLVPQGEYLNTLNRFLAWYYFSVKSPDRYLKSMITRHYNRMLT